MNIQYRYRYTTLICNSVCSSLKKCSVVFQNSCNLKPKHKQIPISYNSFRSQHNCAIAILLVMDDLHWMLIALLSDSRAFPNF